MHKIPVLFLLALSTQLHAETHQQMLATDKPAAVWSFDDQATPGPRPPQFPQFPATNQAATFAGKGGPVRIKDDGEKSAFDFDLGDTLTIEAWVACRELKDGQQVYIVGKGRTQNPGVAAHNQNWALRLRGRGGNACVSFLFRDARNRPDSGDEDWHRWTSTAGFAANGEWHHVAVTYTFGKSASVRGFIDGADVTGAWDMGGATELGPVVDNDDVWLGSSMGGSAGSSLNGAIDEVALHRRALDPARIKVHAQRDGAAPALKITAAKPDAEGDPVPPPTLAIAELPRGSVRVEVFEHRGKGEDAVREGSGNDSRSAKDDGGLDASWSTLPDERTDEYTQPAFALAALTNKYNERGVKVDRSRPFLVRASAAVTLPPGEHRILLRALNGSRLALDGRPLALTAQLKRRSGDDEPVPDQAAIMAVPGVHLLPPGHHEALATVKGDGQPHVLTVEAFVGGKSVRPELGELTVAISSDNGPWRVLQPAGSGPAFDEVSWKNFADSQRAHVATLDAARRRQPAEESYWRQRHDLARQNAKPAPPVPENKTPGGNAIDAFLAAKPGDAKLAPLLDDAAFLRRLTLDVAGVIPTAQEVTAFLADTAPGKRARAIDRLLADPRWADRWVPYWQDVLAENPALLKGMLNNTGPFRWWLHEALLDNLPLDRFVTALISMEGSTNYGGPAGFGIATQNDLPMAAKAQIISSAFLAMQMKCARCHDAPNHPYNQADLLSIAAMLQRGAIKVPASSLTQGLSENSHVVVSLKPGQAIDPHWPFDQLPGEPLPGVLRKDGDTRERLAALLTDPRNERFAQVAANRLWREFLGFGIVDPADDWEDTAPSHPALLAWLGRELIVNDYDTKHLARLILNSHAYQRAATPAGSRIVKSRDRLFDSPARRRMSAEQLVDSLFAVTGAEFDAEQMTMDPENRQNPNDLANLGTPRRAWEFAGLGNERDRPALAKPRAQIIGDVLEAFGWRESRAEPRTVRDHDANVLQPALLANGTLGARLTRLTDDHAFTTLALAEQPVGELVRQGVLRILSREPSADELARFTALLAPDYDTRRTHAAPAPRKAPNARAVSWANHLNPDATNVVLAIEKEVKAGPAATPRLTPAWRERMEDMLWALLLTPEFVHIP